MPSGRASNLPITPHTRRKKSMQGHQVSQGAVRWCTTVLTFPCVVHGATNAPLAAPVHTGHKAPPLARTDVISAIAWPPCCYIVQYAFGRLQGCTRWRGNTARLPGPGKQTRSAVAMACGEQASAASKLQPEKAGRGGSAKSEHVGHGLTHD